MRPILKVLIVDDSPTARQLMTHIVSAAPDMHVVGEAFNGNQAVKLTLDLHPDIILMDIVMPGMNGLEATREIMNAMPTPIVMTSASLENDETDVAFQAIRLGALSVLKKPVGPKNPDYPAQSAALVNTVRALAGVRVIHHQKQGEAVRHPDVKTSLSKGQAQPEIVAIAASTGGPAALSEIFKGLPANFALPVVVVQHISPEFLPSLVEWLGTITSLRIEIARAGDQPLPEHIYFAPGDAHLRLSKRRRFELDRLVKTSYIPSGDILLESIATSYGSSAIGVVLTGMGNDGARGLQAMHNIGAHTIAQDEATSVIFGMPQEAIALGAAAAVLPIQEIAQAVIDFHASKTELATIPSPCIDSP
jgi:two-component system chemotaxis response regulator CheB